MYGGDFMKIISGNANTKLASEVVRCLGTELCDADIKRFSDGEVWVEIKESVRGQDCFIIQSTAFPTNDNLMELLIIIEALRRGSARTITAVIPYYGYARQDRKSGPRTPITAKLVARMLETAGIDRVMTMDLHANQIQGFFEVPADNLYAQGVLYQHLCDTVQDVPLCVVSPDVGGVARARAFARIAGDVDLAIIDKRRPKAGLSEVMNIIGDVAGKQCVLVDDMADSAGTLCNAAEALMAKGASSVSAYVSHGVFSGPAVERITQSALRHVVSTDTIAKNDMVAGCNKIIHVSVAPLLAEAIDRTMRNESISELFKIQL